MANNLSWWQKIKALFNSDNDEGGDGSGKNKLEGQGFRDPRLPQRGKNEGDQFVKNPQTAIYDELKQDPAAMAALKAITNGQIPISEATALYEQIRNSDAALTTVLNAASTPTEIKQRARRELEERANERRNKLQAEPGFKPEPPKPGF